MTVTIREITVHPDAAGSPVARRIIETCSGAAVRVAAAPPKLEGDGTRSRKDAIFITPRRGGLMKRCPGTQSYICCGYRVLNLVTGCPLDCTYCILQLYLNQPCLVVHSDWEDALREIDELTSRRPGRVVRLGTGELADSLALEPLTDMAKELIPLILQRPEAVLELKTKTTFVENLLDIDPRGWIYPDRFGRAVKDNVRRNNRFYPAAIRPLRFAYPMRAFASRLRESGRQERSYP